MWSELGPYLGPSAIAALAVIAVLTGRLVPVRTLNRELTAKQAEIDRLSAALTRAEFQRDRLMGLAGDVTAGIVKAIPAVVAPARDPVS